MATIANKSEKYSFRWRSILDESEWTTVPPTTPGWYWARFSDGFPPETICVLVEFNPTTGELQDAHGNWVLDNITNWLGPLPMPETPKEKGKSNG